MKKRLVVKFVVGAVLMVLIVSVLSFTGMTAGAEHPLHVHDFVIDRGYDRAGPAVSISDSRHIGPVYYKRECICGAISYTLGYLEENHSKVYFDLGHVPGTQTHKREAMCQYCNYHAILTYYCPGNPCIDPHD